MSYIDISGAWVFLYSGQRTPTTIPMRDSFFCRQAISLYSITGVFLDMERRILRLQVKGFPDEVVCKCRTEGIFEDCCHKLLDAMQQVGLDKRYMLPLALQ